MRQILLLSNILKENPKKALEVALEEITLIDSANATDTEGDEGDAFARQILGLEEKNNSANRIDKQYGLVEVNGEKYVGELAHSRMSVSSIETIDASTIKVTFTEDITSTETSLATFLGYTMAPQLFKEIIQAKPQQKPIHIFNKSNRQTSTTKNSH